MTEIILRKNRHEIITITAYPDGFTLDSQNAEFGFSAEFSRREAEKIVKLLTTELDKPSGSHIGKTEDQLGLPKKEIVK